MKKSRKIRIISVIGLVLTVGSMLTGCGSKTTTGNQQGPSSAETRSAYIGTSGGSVSLSSGAAIDIPQWGLAGGEVIQLTETADSSALIPDPVRDSLNGKYYILEPDGLLLDVPAAVTIPYGTLPAGVATSDLVVEFFDGENWVPVPRMALDELAGTISAAVDHFTAYRVTYTWLSTHDYTLSSDQVSLGNCGDYLVADFSVFGPMNKAGLTSPGTPKLDNWRVARATRFQLLDTSTGRTVRTIHVYSIGWQESRLVPGGPVFNPGNRSLNPNEFLPDAAVYNLGMTTQGDGKLRVVHFPVIFDEQGRVLNKPQDDLYRSGTFEVSRVDYEFQNEFGHGTLPVALKKSIPLSVLMLGHQFQAKIKVKDVGGWFEWGSYVWDSTFETQNFTVNEGVPACEGVGLKIPRISLTQPARSKFNEGESITFTCVAKDSLGNAPTPNLIRWRLDGVFLGTGMSVTVSPGVGSYTVGAAFTDLFGQKASASKTITVSRIIPLPSPVPVPHPPLPLPNLPPVFTSGPSLSAFGGRAYFYDANYSDPDGDICRFSLVSGPPGMTIETATGVVRWTPPPGTTGDRSVTLRLDDQRGHLVDQSWKISVANPPLGGGYGPPVISQVLVDNPVIPPGGRGRIECRAYSSSIPLLPLTYTWEKTSSTYNLLDLEGNPAVRVFDSNTFAGGTFVYIHVSDGTTTVTGKVKILVQSLVPPDFDGDGYNNTVDCNDFDAAINPATTWYKDADYDGYSDGTTLPGCVPPAGYRLPRDLVALTGDCNDNDPTAYATLAWFKDSDNDGYSSRSTLKVQCARPTGYKSASELVSLDGDCDDNDPTVHAVQTWYKDADNDGYSDGTSLPACNRPSGYKTAGQLISLSGDCDDSDSAEYPGQTWYRDQDGDGYHDGTSVTQCTRPAGYKLYRELLSLAMDPDDLDPAVTPASSRTDYSGKWRLTFPGILGGQDRDILFTQEGGFLMGKEPRCSLVRILAALEGSAFTGSVYNEYKSDYSPESDIGGITGRFHSAVAVSGQMAIGSYIYSFSGQKLSDDISQDFVSVPQAAITVDGNPSDWAGIIPIFSDPAGNECYSTISLARNGNTLFLKVESKWFGLSYLILSFDNNKNGTPDSGDRILKFFYSGTEGPQLTALTPLGLHIPVNGAVEAGGTVLEARVDIDLLGLAPDFILNTNTDSCSWSLSARDKVEIILDHLTSRVHDLAGAWSFHTLIAGDAALGQTNRWEAGKAVIDPYGYIRLMSWVDGAGVEGSERDFSSQPLSVSPVGVVNFPWDLDFRATLSLDKRTMVQTDYATAPDSTGYVLGIMQKMGARYAPGDLAGTWEMFNLVSGDSPQWVGFYYGTITIDSTGNAAWGFTHPGGSHSTGNMAVSLSPDGSVTMANGNFFMSGGKTLMVGTLNDGGGGATLSVGVKSGSGFVQGDLSGVWWGNELAVGDAGNNWAERDQIAIESNGSCTNIMGEELPVGWKGGALAVSRDFSLGMDGSFGHTDYTAPGYPFFGWMSPDKNLAVEVGGTKMMTLYQRAIPSSQVWGREPGNSFIKKMMPGDQWIYSYMGTDMGNAIAGTMTRNIVADTVTSPVTSHTCQTIKDAYGAVIKRHYFIQGLDGTLRMEGESMSAGENRWVDAASGGSYVYRWSPYSSGWSGYHGTFTHTAGGSASYAFSHLGRDTITVPSGTYETFVFREREVQYWPGEEYHEINTIWYVPWLGEVKKVTHAYDIQGGLLQWERDITGVLTRSSSMMDRYFGGGGSALPYLDISGIWAPDIGNRYLELFQSGNSLTGRLVEPGIPVNLTYDLVGSVAGTVVNILVHGPEGDKGGTATLIDFDTMAINTPAGPETWARRNSPPVWNPGSQYQVWGGNSDIISDGTEGYSPSDYGYTCLGTATGTATFDGTYSFYILTVSGLNIAYVDAVQGSDLSFLTSNITGNTQNWANIGAAGEPDGKSAAVGLRDSGSYGERGYLVFHPSSPMSSIKVILASP